MINHAIDNLTIAQEDSYLTTGLTPFVTFDDAGRRCHMGILSLTGYTWGGYRHSHEQLLIDRFNTLCMKLGGAPRSLWASLYYRHPCTERDLAGAARLGQMIRARILENRARRVLASVQENHKEESWAR